MEQESSSESLGQDTISEASSSADSIISQALHCHSYLKDYYNQMDKRAKPRNSQIRKKILQISGISGQKQKGFLDV